MQTPVVAKGTFTDSEEWITAVSDWNLQFRQIDRGELRASVERVMSPSIVVQRVQLSRRFHQSGFAPDGVLTFGLPDQCETLSWLCNPAQQHSMMNFNRRNGFDCVSESGFAANTFSVSSDVFEQEAAALGFSMSADQVVDSAEQFLVGDDNLKQIRALTDGLLALTSHDGFSAEMIEEIQSDLMHLLVCSVADPETQAVKSNLSQRHRAVNRALELIKTDMNTSSLGEIYEYSGVSYRTLNRAFKERFGVGPKQYIIATRLIEVRRTLMSSQGDLRITDVASDWGFWHLGRFARDYKRMFGELPSDTIKNRVQ